MDSRRYGNENYNGICGIAVLGIAVDEPDVRRSEEVKGEQTMKRLDVDEFNEIVGKALENCREKETITESFYQGAKIILDKINEMAEETDDE